MLVRNFLKTGCYATVVPIGVSFTIRYNDKGLIDKVTRGYDKNAEDDPELLKKFIEESLVPRTAPADGTHWIQGVMFTHNMVSESVDGKNIEDMLYDKFMKDSAGFEFFAGNAVSASQQATTSVGVNNWLGLAKYKTLPGFIVPSGLTPELLDHIIDNGSYKFDYPLVAGFWVWQGSDRSYHDNGLRLAEVTALDLVVDPSSGRVFYDLTLAGGENYTSSYNEVRRFNVCKGDKLVIDYSGSILHNFMRPKFNGVLYYECKYCGEKFTVDNSDITCCKNPHCTSLLFSATNRFLSILGFDSVEYSEYQDITKLCGKAYMLPDILELEKFKDIERDCTLEQILTATIPQKYVPADSRLIHTLLQDSNNNANTIIYYIEHFDRFLKSSNYVIDCNIQTWLADDRNILELKAVIDNPHINIIGGGKKFNGPQIFRDKKILITGRFLHGTVEDIRSIFASYGAETVTQYDSSIDCLVIGDMQEDINGSIITTCRKHNLPVFGETEFFNKYDIDSDLSNNL